MPEVCEIALTSEILYNALDNYELADIKVIDKKFKKIPDNLAKIKKMLPLKVNDISSKGKLMWIEFLDEKDKVIYMTTGFGLEGKWSFDENKYSKMNFKFEKKSNVKTLWWNDIFSYGNIKFYTDKQEFIKKINSLGMDFLKSDYDYHTLWNKITKIKKTKYKDKMMVELLMDQKKLGSGLGNYLTPEILYRAKIKPSRKIKTLTEDDVKILTKTIKKVLKLCYHSNDNKYLTLLQSYLDKHVRKHYLENVDVGDDGFEFLVYRRKEDDFGNTVKADKLIKGRTTYWVPKIQT